MTCSTLLLRATTTLKDRTLPYPCAVSPPYIYGPGNQWPVFSARLPIEFHKDVRLLCLLDSFMWLGASTPLGFIYPYG